VYSLNDDKHRGDLVCVHKSTSYKIITIVLIVYKRIVCIGSFYLPFLPPLIL
jgi:hypothetical protein